MRGTAPGRRRRLGAGALAAGVVVLASAGLVAAAQPAPTDPQLFDLELAQGELDALETRIDDLQLEIDRTIDLIDAMSIEMQFVTLNEPTRAETLQEARTRARQMAIAAYVGIGPPLSGIDLLDAATASDLSWRNAIMRQQAERLKAAAETYASLAEEVDASVLAISDAINAETRILEALNRELSQVIRAVPQAEWYVEIALIHDLADQEFAENGRAEPTPEQWRQLRFCESTETYAIDTGNSFYGAYQFTWDTWTTVGGEGNPALAHPAEQDARARLLYSRRGSQPWPICGRYLP